MTPDYWQLYRDMLKSRLFEEAVLKLWELGKISGEMHLAIGEEAISAGVVDHMQEGDALALDHRGTPQLLMRGIDPVRLLLEFLGHPEGLCAGMGGHMHLFSKDHLVATSGIVGASCPAAVGFALAGRHLRPGRVSVAFFGEGAVNQGMVMESFNLAAIWKLPVIFVCKDNKRVFNTPISEGAFVGAAVHAAMAGLKPVVEVMLVDFIAVALDPLLNHAAKLETFSGGRWRAPLVVRCACGGGYGDGGQHEQSLWGWLAHIPGLAVVVPSSPADAGGLMLAAIRHPGPVIFLEHKLLSDYWLDYMGGSSRHGLEFDVPAEGAFGPVPDKWEAVPLGQAAVRRAGEDITVASVGVGVHRGLEAADELDDQGISCEVVDLRSVAPLDTGTLTASVAKTGRLLVVDEDYRRHGLSGELAAVVLENRVSFKYARVCTEDAIPYNMKLEGRTLPNKERIIEKAVALTEDRSCR